MLDLTPRREDLDLSGLSISDEAMDELLDVDRAGWQREYASIGEYLEEFGARMPLALKREHSRISAALAASSSPSRPSAQPPAQAAAG